jgi:hypothetical protein
VLARVLIERARELFFGGMEGELSPRYDLWAGTERTDLRDPLFRHEGCIQNQVISGAKKATSGCAAVWAVPVVEEGATCPAPSWVSYSALADREEGTTEAEGGFTGISQPRSAIVPGMTTLGAASVMALPAAVMSSFPLLLEHTWRHLDHRH